MDSEEKARDISSNQELKEPTEDQVTDAASLSGRLGSKQGLDSGSYFKQLGARGGAATLKKYGREYYRKLGQKGGMKVKRKYGKEYYKQIGSMGGAIVREAFELLEKNRMQRAFELMKDLEALKQKHGDLFKSKSKGGSS